MTENELRTAVTTWIDDDPDTGTADELRQLLDALPDTAAELADRFAGPLVFGTAGLRGAVRAGPNGMNRAVVRAATAGLASYLDSLGDEAAGPVVIGYDARHGSEPFAHEAARVVAGTGRRAILLPGRLPTPVLAFAVRALEAAAGVMVTASHNPPADNGYKVYLGGNGRGGQIAPPTDAGIEAAIRQVGRLRDVPLSDDFERLDHTILESYLDTVAALVHPDGPREITVASTALHGVGGQVLADAYKRAGFAAPIAVPDQQDPDPDFPTVAFPNPEEPGAMDLVRELAAREGVDLIIANDPDADRCAVAIPDPAAGDPKTAAGWRILHGDEVGALLADHLIRRGRRGTYATTIVSASMLRAIATTADQPYAETLTGFKWIVRGDEETGIPLAFGYEEALGYCVAPDVVRDKDGISAALLVAELAAGLKAEGRTLLDRLDELATTHGLHSTSQLSVRVADLSLITDAMRRLRATGPTQLLGREITEVTDLLPRADVLVFRTEGIRVVIRPSGTEPKLKAYTEVVLPVPADTTVAAVREEAGELHIRLKPELSALLGLA